MYSFFLTILLLVLRILKGFEENFGDVKYKEILRKIVARRAARKILEGFLRYEALREENCWLNSDEEFFWA